MMLTLGLRALRLGHSRFGCRGARAEPSVLSASEPVILSPEACRAVSQVQLCCYLLNESGLSLRLYLKNELHC